MTTWQTRGRCEQYGMPWLVHAPEHTPEDPGVIREQPCTCGGRIVIDEREANTAAPIYEASDARLR